MACYQRFVLMLLTLLAASLSKLAFSAGETVDCSTVTALLSACSSFVNYGSPDPSPGSPCCTAMTTLYTISEAVDSKRDVCRCFMDLISTFNSNATAIATLPGFCGVSLGFIIDPNTDCE
ncbi:hypothetical protein Leryth_017396 [Lithospermum erythrorhizon]|uniref:Bifunctional inhibitor/plant lipid transfer protein/seed storage helical domain-containing protein n=1 Tax=Lithospermum erythrorhizon TaxID=34254 RepID=A0AAV3QE09_LITER|nr:hypothetical protein Leryth_017396 [Lithospermum erythrorhizon]